MSKQVTITITIDGETHTSIVDKEQLGTISGIPTEPEIPCEVLEEIKKDLIEQYNNGDRTIFISTILSRYFDIQL